MKDSINILGTEYSIRLIQFKNDPDFEKREINGYCRDSTHDIILCDMNTYPGWENEPQEAKESVLKVTLRHELIHAFLSESGLDDSAAIINSAWAKNEEMVEWIAIQSPKIFKVFKELDILE